MRSVFVLLAVLAFGCTAPPEKTCEAVIKLRRADAASHNKPFPPEKEAQVRDKCVADMREMDGRDPDAYKCAANCIGRVNDLDLAATCVSLCDYKKNAAPAPSASLVPATP